MPTAERLLSLLSLLQARRDWPGPLLAARLQVSDRTVRRDIDRLREMGYRIQAAMGPDGGYRLEAGSELPPLLFDDDQAVAVALALQTASAIGAGLEESAVRALATIRQVMPSHLRHRLDALQITAIRPGPGGEESGRVSAETLVALSKGIRAERVLRFDYGRPGSPSDAEGQQKPSRRAEPHHLVSARGRWYLVAWDLEKEDWRLFAADRIELRVPDGPRFIPREVPGGDVREFVSARFKGQDVNRWPCHGTVLLHLPAHRVLPFIGDATVLAIDEERCRLEVGSWSWGALAASLGLFEAEMDIIEPPELAVAFSELAARYAAAVDRADERG